MMLKLLQTRGWSGQQNKIETFQVNYSDRPQIEKKIINNLLSIYNSFLSDNTHVEVVSDSHELFRSVDLVSIDLVNCLLSVVHQLQELSRSLIKESLDKGQIFLPERHDCFTRWCWTTEQDSTLCKDWKKTIKRFQNCYVFTLVELENYLTWSAHNYFCCKCYKVVTFITLLLHHQQQRCMHDIYHWLYGLGIFKSLLHLSSLKDQSYRNLWNYILVSWWLKCEAWMWNEEETEPSKFFIQIVYRNSNIQNISKRPGSTAAEKESNDNELGNFFTFSAEFHCINFKKYLVSVNCFEANNKTDV